MLGEISGHCCAQLGESCGQKCKLDVLAATQMPARAKKRCNEVEFPSYLITLLEELGFAHMQGTVFKHHHKEIYISAHIDDLLLVANKVDAEEVCAKLSENLTLKKDGPY